MSGDSSGYILALDVGTTTVRCKILSRESNNIGLASTKVDLLYPKPDYVEINPDQLWSSILEIIRRSIKDSNISVKHIRSLGISTQRATFLTWRKDTGTPFHNLITWKDLRAKKMVNDVNSSISMSVTVRLLWILSQNEAVKKALAEDNVSFGTLETWLLYKFTNGKTYISDISNASATGFYDPFQLDWGFWATKILKIPEKILPPVVENDFNFGSVSEELFGHSIPIGCVMSDQSSSMFGSCCFKNNDLKVTLGTGAFLDVNTSDKIQTSLKGMYPLVGWRLNDEITYLVEVPNNDAGSVIEWAMKAGFIENPSQTAEIANSVENSDGVYFVAAFSGLGPPINNEKAGTGFIGIKPTTRKAHMVRALLESIAFRTVLAYYVLKEERPAEYISVRVDGGVSKNDFICQLLADLTELRVERLESAEMSVLGVGFLAGLSCGIWKSREELKKFCKVEKVFVPSSNIEHKASCIQDLQNWTIAAERFQSWYDECLV